MSRPDILLPRKMPPAIEAQLDRLFTVHRYRAGRADTLLPDVGGKIRGLALDGVPVDADLLAQLPNVEIAACYGSGYDHIKIEDCHAASVMVTHTPDIHSEEVADSAMGLLLMSVRELSQAEQWLRSGNWKAKGAYPPTKATVQGRTLGIFGLGRIGKAIARRAEAFGLAVHYHGRTRQVGVGYPYHATLESLANACDTLMVVVPGGAATRHAVNSRILEALGADGILINIGRGPVVDEAALIQALETGTIHGAGLDVFEAEPEVPQALLSLPRVTVLPHVGSASEAARHAMGQLVVDNLKSWFTKGTPLTPVPEMKGMNR